MRRFKVGDASEGVRIDTFLADKYPQFSRSSLVALFTQRMVKVNGKITKPGWRLKPTDNVSVDDSLLKAGHAPLELPVIYEDGDVIVISKPSGALTHSKGALNQEATVASSLRDKVSLELTGNRAGIVHRLDRGTSGVMIVAKTSNALAYLQKQFASRKTDKTYMAVVEGVPEPAEALIDAPIARNPRKPQAFQVDSLGKPAQTRYRLKKAFKKDEREYAVLELEPVTGRTHQIRVHLKHIGHPVVGDPAYGRGGDNLLLHAAKLVLVLPKGIKSEFKAPVPAHFKEFIDG